MNANVLLCGVLFLWGGAGVAQGQLPKSWIKRGSQPDDYLLGIDRTVRHGGKASGFIKAKSADAKGFATLMQVFRADDYRGKRLRLSGYVKSDKIGNWAGLWMRIDGESRVLAFDNMQNRKIQGTRDWKKYSVVLNVPKESVNISFGVLSGGKGQVWVDDLRFEVVGKDVRTTNISLRDYTIPKKLKPAKQKKPLALDFEK